VTSHLVGFAAEPGKQVDADQLGGERLCGRYVAGLGPARHEHAESLRHDPENERRLERQRLAIESGQNRVVGFEYQLLDDERHPDAKAGRDGNRTLASLYDLITADQDPRFVKKPGEWNHARIVVQPDGHVEHWLNHRKVVEYEKGSPVLLELVARSKYKNWKGFGTWERGHLLLQDHGNHVSFRSIKVKELS